MHFTIFKTPVLKTLVRWFSRLMLKITGWKTVGVLPDDHKFVMIAAPHTSNWDLVFMLYTAFVFKLSIYWMGKATIFKRPFKYICMWLGGIPIDRSKSNNVVDQSINHFKNNEQFVLAVPPSGTRNKVTKWKTGFYHIAWGAKVPIVLGFLDYKEKQCGVLGIVYPTGNIEYDMDVIQGYYEGVTGKYPEKTMDKEVFEQAS